MLAESYSSQNFKWSTRCICRTIKQGGHTNSKLYNYSNKNRTHPIKGAYAREVDSWNNNTSPIKALVNSGIGYALAPAAQAVYDYTKGALDISN